MEKFSSLKIKKHQRMKHAQFQLPDEYIDKMMQIKMDDLRNFYFNLNFIYLNFENRTKRIKNDFFDFLYENKLIVYKFLPNPRNPTKDNNIIFAYENSCIILESVNKKIIQQKMSRSKSIFLNADTYQYVDYDDLQFWLRIVRKNKFVKYTIDPIITYIIQRFYYPSNLFKDKTFLSFNPKIQFQDENFIRLKSITGTSATISISLYLPTFQLFAVKKFNNFDKYQRELNFCQKHSHRVFVPFYGSIEKRDEYKIIYKFMSNDSLKAYVEENKSSITSIFALTALNRISQGIEYLHSNHLIHRDLQPQNILIDNDFEVYISDFETIKNIDDSEDVFTQNIGSELYNAPEQNSDERISYEADIYTFGQLMYFLFEKENMFNIMKTGFLEIDKLKSKNKHKVLDIKNASSEISYLCKRCLNSNPSERPNIKEIQKIISKEVYTPYMIRDFYFFQMEKQIVTNYCYENIQLAFSTRIANNKKYYWIFTLFYFLNMIKCPNLYLFLGYFYFYGDDYRRDNRKDTKDPHKDLTKAKKAFELAANSGNSEAHLRLGDMYYYGQSVPIDYNKAKYHYEIACEKENSEAFIRLGDFYYNDRFKDYKMAKKYYKLAAQRDNPDALLFLGNLYHDGKRVKQDFSKSRKYYEKAAFLKNSDAILQLGNLYFYGEGVEKNYKIARKLYEDAANFNNNTAFLCLGNIYNDGKGVEIDIAKSIKFYTLSYRIHNENCVPFKTDIDSLRSCTISFNNLGVIYAIEKGFQNNHLADCFLYKSVCNEYSLGLNNCGLFRELVLNWNGDVEYFYEKAAKQGFALAEFNLGRLKEKEENIDDAIQFYIRASDNENNPLVFKGKEIHDERFQLSKTFIICVTNLKLSLFFIKSDHSNAQKYFTRAFSTIINIYKQNFRFDSNNNDDVYSYIKDFILGFPLFSTPRSLNKINIKEVHDFIQREIFDKMDQKQNKEKKNETILDSEILSIEAQKIIDKECKTEHKNETKSEIIDNPDDLFIHALKNEDLLIRTISSIIDKMNTILFTPPYSILFSRIKN